MKSLWRRRSAVVKDVQADLLPERQLAYTTVMTVMDRLFKKGALKRVKKSRAHVYEPAFGESEARAGAVMDLVDSFFSGSKHSLSLYLDGRSQSSGEGTAEPKTPAAHPIDDSLL